MSTAETLWFLNTHISLRRPSSASEDGVSLTEHWLPPGDSAPLHVHHRQDEVFHILEGEIRFLVGDAEVRATAGDTLVGPKGVPHSYRVGSAGARMLVMTPGEDFEGLIRAMSRPAERRALPEPEEPTPDLIAALSEAAERNHITILGPPMA